MHIGDPEDCIFGCRRPDMLTRYVCCGFVRDLLNAVGLGHTGDMSPAQCFGLVDGLDELESRIAFRHAALATAAYHAARARHRASLLTPADTRDIAGA